MRISIRQLKQIIKEQVEEAKKGGRQSDIEIEETEVDLDRPARDRLGGTGRNRKELDQETFEKIARIVFSLRPERNKAMDTLDSYIGKQFINDNGKSVEIGDVYVDEIGQSELSSVDGRLITSFVSNDFYRTNKGGKAGTPR